MEEAFFHATALEDWLKSGGIFLDRLCFADDVLFKATNGRCMDMRRCWPSGVLIKIHSNFGRQRLNPVFIFSCLK